jgi:hypothetical protein
VITVAVQLVREFEKGWGAGDDAKSAALAFFRVEGDRSSVLFDYVSHNLTPPASGSPFISSAFGSTV